MDEKIRLKLVGAIVRIAKSELTDAEVGESVRLLVKTFETVDEGLDLLTLIEDLRLALPKDKKH